MELVKLTREEFDRMARVIYDRTGIHLPAEKLNLLSNRLRKRLRVLDLDSFAAYHDLIADPARCQEELPHFLSAVTTNETYFFRNEQLWTYIAGDFVTRLAATRGAHRSVRVWSAASSTGAEAYTTAIVLRESLPDFNAWQVSICGSDISENVLAQARAALYDEYAVSKMSKERIRRCFTRVGDRYQLNDELRAMVRFQFHNLRDPFPNARFDLIFLRNVLMYFDTQMKQRVIQNVIAALAPNGQLIVGDVDPIRTVPELRACMTLDYVRPGVYAKPAGAAASAAERKGVALV